MHGASNVLSHLQVKRVGQVALVASRPAAEVAGAHTTPYVHSDSPLHHIMLTVSAAAARNDKLDPPGMREQVRQLPTIVKAAPMLLHACMSSMPAGSSAI